MKRRCFSAEPIASTEVTLDGSEAHHLLHVMRATPGMQVTLFDGSGVEFDAEVAACKRSTVELRVLGRHEVDCELSFPLTLGVPLPKGDRQRWIVEKAAELGVVRLVPLVTERSVATGEKRLSGKLDRYVIETSKQCGRNRLMDISAAMTWGEWLELPSLSQVKSTGDAPRKWIAHTSGRQMTSEDLATRRPSYVAVGPEGGLTSEEAAAAASSGWELVGLGDRILRIETAAIAIVAALTLPKSAD